MNLPEGILPRSVSQITNAVLLRLEEHFPEVWIVGEVISFKRLATGHCIFTLQDAYSQLKCFFHKNSHTRLHRDLKDGMQVITRGSITAKAWGDYQLLVLELDQRGVGAEELALRELKERLSNKGYFLPGRKRQIVAYPNFVAIVTSATGAVIRDMLEIFGKRWPRTGILVYPCKVQGEGAAEQIASNIAMLNYIHRSKKIFLDAIIIGRGGGSTKDLSAFNQEIVVEAIVQSVIPVVSAVGHEVDLTLSDLAADLRAETPTAAVMRITPDRSELIRLVRTIEMRLKEATLLRFKQARVKLNQIAGRPVIRNPLERLRREETRLKQSAQLCLAAVQRQVERRKERLRAAVERLESLSPLGILKRGYSLTQRGDGKLITDGVMVQPGEVIQTRLAKGTIISKVIQTEVGPSDVA